jgi:hypothetical protein
MLQFHPLILGSQMLNGRVGILLTPILEQSAAGVPPRPLMWMIASWAEELTDTSFYLTDSKYRAKETELTSSGNK